MAEQDRASRIGSLAPTRHAASQFPISAAFAFAVQGIRLRLGRMLLVFLGISLAMAFTGALLATDVLYRYIPMEAGAGRQAAGAFRWMWVAVALLISTSGTLNAILMSVTERIKEIGTLKCLGAKSIHIIQIFVFESVLLGLLGGLVGGIMGYLFALTTFVLNIGARYLSGEALLQAAQVIAVCVGTSTGLALLASIIPVLVAAKIEPASAMRYEV
jgi:putative ABC transport system permease protein